MEIKRITEKEFNKNIKELEEAIFALKQILTISTNINENSYFPFEIGPSKIEDYISKTLKKIEVFNKQFNCKPENVSDFSYIGRNHKNNYYEKKCEDRNLIVERYSE